MVSKTVLLCLGVVLLVAISEARPAGDNGGTHTHTHTHTHHTHTETGGGGGGPHIHTHHHKGSPHVHRYHTGGSTHHHRIDGSETTINSSSSDDTSDDGNKGGSPSGGSLTGDLNLPDINLSGNLGGKGKLPSGSLNVGSLTGNLDGKLPDLDLGGGDLNIDGDDGDSGDGDGDGDGDAGTVDLGSGGLRVPGFLDPTGEAVSLDGGNPPEDIIQRFVARLKSQGIAVTPDQETLLRQLVSHKYGHLGVDSTAPRECTDEYFFNDGVLKHFVRGTRDAGDALLSGLHDVIQLVVGDEGVLKNLDDGLLRGLQHLLCGAENAFSDFADDWDSATHIAKHGLIDIFKLQGDGLLAFPEGIAGIAGQAAEAIGSAAYDAVSAIVGGLGDLVDGVAG